MTEKRNEENGLASVSSYVLPFSASKLFLLIVSSFGFRASSFSAAVQTFDGQTFRGAAVISDAIEISTGDGPAKIAFDQVLRASFADSATDEKVHAGLVLTNGTRLAGPLGALGGAAIELPGRGLRVPAPVVAWIVYSPFSPALTANLPAGRTGALLPGGDFFEGALKGADAAQCKLLNPIFGLRTFDVRRGELLALVLRDAKPTPANFEVRGVDGSVYFADSVAPWKGSLTLRGAHFESLSLKPEEIAELRAGSARYQPLTHLKPARIPAPQHFAIDKTLAGESLIAEDGSPARGIESAVGEAGAWELPTGFTVLTVRVRVPADVPPINKLIFVIYANGRAVHRSPALTSESAAVTLRAPLGTARSLALRVEGVSPADSAGRGIWIEPILLRR